MPHPRPQSARRARAPAHIPPPPAFPWPGVLAEMDPATRGMSLALIVSVLLHGLVLSLQFRFPQPDPNRLRDAGLEVVLVNSKSASKPLDPQVKAQANLDGGGNTDENRRAKTPLPALPAERSGDQVAQAQKRVQELEARQQQLLSQVQSQATVATTGASAPEPQPDPEPAARGADMATMALAMARLEGQIARQVDEYNKRPRKKFIGARAQEAVEAMYVEDWRQKVERVGNLHYPDEARGKLYGNLILTVEIRADGNVNKIEINRSSGRKVLDRAAEEIVRRASPFGAFPQALRERVDILVITRTWTFTNDQLVSE